MQYLVGAAALPPPLVVFALRLDWGVTVGFTPALDLDEGICDQIAQDLVDEIVRTGRDRAWRTSVT